jgi:hypothetical protein
MRWKFLRDWLNRMAKDEARNCPNAVSMGEDAYLRELMNELIPE